MLTNACLLHSTFTGKIYVNIIVRKSWRPVIKIFQRILFFFC
jgi:hypothetical protein